MAAPDAAEGPLGDEVDLTNCDREPIHIVGQVQDFGCLLAVSSDWIVLHASTNVAGILALDPEAIVGTPLAEHLPAETIHALRGRLALAARTEETARIFGLDVMGDGQRRNVALSQGEDALLIEVEPAHATTAEDALTLVQPIIARIGQKDSVEALCQEAARGLKAIVGFDRVMVYRFEEDGSGTVIAEATRFGVEPFLGLRYPASDIPKQARALYLRNRLRILPDVDGAVHDIVPQRGPNGAPLDLSAAVTRAMSPIHAEYLRNMGVRASLSVSIVRRGKLWGLFACHHESPRPLDYRLRTAAELFAQLFSYELSAKLSDEESAQAARARSLHNAMMSRISSGEDLGATFETTAREIGEVIAFDGIALWIDGHYSAIGAAPTREEFLGLARYLNTAATSRVHATDAIAEGYPGADGFVDRAAGLLSLPISRTPRDYLVLFRREIARSVRWAGNPDKPALAGPNGIRLTPRKSFEAWQEVVRGRSAPWTASELQAAEAVRITLLEVILKMTDEAKRAAQRASEQQELLIAELNHRVRNILNLIRGLVGQTREGAAGIEDFSATLGGRIQALARAHDQLTAETWGPSSLHGLIDVEAEAYLDGEARRLRIEGPDVLLEPAAVTTLALVLHELVTNSVKYGALSRPEGRVVLTVAPQEDGALEIRWDEAGGPPTQAPTRRGFGTTIIERSIPFELGGTAELNYRLTGVEARFVVPARHVAGLAANAPAKRAAAAPAPPETLDLAGRPVLVVEDNLIIALDAVDHLEAAGAAPVHSAASVAEALAVIEATPDLAAAVLDVNLGAETSQVVAERLRGLGVPFVLATGYGGSDALGGFPEAPVIAKPYAAEMLTAALTEALR